MTSTAIDRRVALLLVLGTVACVRPSTSTRIPDDSGARRAASIASGRASFERHCAVCHGERGDGAGPAAAFLFPPARDLSHDRFRLVSARDERPTHGDVVSTLTRGMPGSAMPAWSWLPAADLANLATYVLEIAPSSALPSAPIPGPRSATHDDLVRGARLYSKHCATCHGEDGTGAREQGADEDGDVERPRDFTAGYLEGGASREALWNRVRYGMPGTEMGPTDLADDDMDALIAHVSRMIPPNAEDRYVQRRERLVARRAEPSELLGTTGSAGSATGEIRVVLAPLHRSDASVTEVRLAARHDGKRLEIRARWQDGTTELPLSGDLSNADAIALQFSPETEPPLVGMGAPEHPTTIWHWRSTRWTDVAGATDLVPTAPHVLLDVDGVARADVPIYRLHQEVADVSTHVDRIDARGIQTIAVTPREPSDVEIRARATEDGWEVVFLRDLVSADARDVAFTLGRSLHIACAVWNGAAGDQGGRKSFGIWQELALEE